MRSITRQFTAARSSRQTLGFAPIELSASMVLTRGVGQLASAIGFASINLTFSGAVGGPFVGPIDLVKP
jgi:hypothetical protein